MNLDNFIIVVYFVIALAIAWYLCRGKIAPHFIGLAGSGASTGLAVGCYELLPIHLGLAVRAALLAK